MGGGVALAKLFGSSARYEILRALTQSPKTVSELEATSMRHDGRSYVI